ncbi:hypothetical protein [Demequina salsinemoris]|uniref:hypothetical protein n=1 Tax=Demequina salsinemoris TaxID=577470 RepID=UPI0007848BB8|nr:hypothetical protein [Demequina salsinemoris]
MRFVGRIHLGWLLLAVVADLAAFLLWNLTFTSCTEAIEGAGSCDTSPAPRIAAGLVLLLSVGFVLKAVTATPRTPGFSSPLTTSAGGSALAERLLYRRDRWGLDYGADLPPCSPAVPLAQDADVQRERFGPLLARLWGDIVATDYADLPGPGPDDDAEAWKALVMGVDERDLAELLEWHARIDRQERALPRDLRHAGWIARETMLTAEPPLHRIAHLPVRGEHLEIVGATIVTSLELYGNAERFVAVLKARLASDLA